MSYRKNFLETLKRVRITSHRCSSHWSFTVVINLYHSLLANSADNTLVIFFFIIILLFPENRICHFMQIVFSGDNLHEISKTFYLGKNKKSDSNCRLLKTFIFFPEHRIWYFMQIEDNLHEVSMTCYLGKYKKINWICRLLKILSRVLSVK